jgi:hypothetical protein
MANCFRLLSANALLVLSFLFFLPFSASAGPLDNWHWRNPLPPAAILRGVAYGDGTWVAVGGHGTVYTSRDGQSWSLGSSGGLDEILAVAWGAGRFVALGVHGTILASSDGVIWTVTRPGQGEVLSNVVFANGQFMIVGNNGTVLVSRDGMNWKTGKVGKTKFLHGVAYGAGRFVAVGYYYSEGSSVYQSTLFTSPDGLHWEAASIDAHDPLTDVAYGNGVFVAVGYYGLLFTSGDGRTWTRIGDEPTGDTFTGVAYGNGRFVAGRAGLIISSVDGIRWEVAQGASGLVQKIAYGGGRWVAVGGDLTQGPCTIYWSDNGLLWEGGALPSIRDDLVAVDYAMGSFSAVGGWNVLLRSPDGVNWTRKNSGTNLSRIAHGNGVYVGLGNNTLLRSLDGEHWVAVESVGSADFADVAYGNGIFLVTGSPLRGLKDVILISSDGLQWTDKSFGTEYYTRRVSYANGLFMIKGSHQVMTTRDGDHWTIREDEAGPGQMVYGNGVFVGVGNGQFWTSNDGEKWSSQGSSDPFCLDVAYGGGHFISAGQVCNSETGVVLTSEDGQAWTLRWAAEDVHIKDVGFGGDAFIIVGRYGLILQSDRIVGPHIAVEPSSVDFGVTGLGSGPEREFTVANDGTEPLDIGTLEETLPPFSVSRNGCSGRTLDVGASCTISFRFSPTKAGFFAAQASLPSSDVDSPVKALSFSGTAAAPDLAGEWTVLKKICDKGGERCKISASFSVRNGGDAASPSIPVRFFLAGPGPFDPKLGVSLKEMATGALAPGKAKVKKVSLALPPGETGEGKALVAVIDPENVVAESDESNNTVASWPLP